MNDERENLKEHRSNLLEEEFVKPMPSIGGKVLHPFSGGRRLLLKKLKNELLTGKGLEEMDNADFATLEFLYLHTLAPDVAAKAVYGDREKWEMAVYEFACQCTPQLNDEVAAVLDILSRARIANVDVEEKPKRHQSDDPEPPPNS
jgi:hypothetical protein